MTELIFEGEWHEMRSELKEWWSGLTDDELATTGGRIDHLVHLLQQKYGYTRERAEVRLAQVEVTVKQERALRAASSYSVVASFSP